MGSFLTKEEGECTVDSFNEKARIYTEESSRSPTERHLLLAAYAEAIKKKQTQNWKNNEYRSKVNVVLC